MTRPLPISGVYAIEGPHGVYVGEASDCWKRGTFALAVLLGWPCGIVREMPNSIALTRKRAEREVALLFTRRGFRVLSAFMGDHYQKIKMGNRCEASWRRLAALPSVQ